MLVSKVGEHMTKYLIIGKQFEGSYIKLHALDAIHWTVMYFNEKDDNLDDLIDRYLEICPLYSWSKIELIPID